MTRCPECGKPLAKSHDRGAGTAYEHQDGSECLV